MASPNVKTGAGQEVDIRHLLDNTPFSPYQWTILILCFLIVLLDGFDTAAIGYIAPSLTAEWSIERSALAPVLSAALFGLAAGAIASGPLADRFGRKSLLLFATLLFGAASLFSAYSTHLAELVSWRFVTGIGLGAAMPCAVTLVSEYCPARQRALLTNIMFCGFPLGAALGGFLAAWMIPAFGWRSVLLLGGIAPLILVILLWWQIPESLRHMVTHSQRYSIERIRAVLMRITPDAAAQATGFHLSETTISQQSSNGTEKGGIALVLSPHYRYGSLMLWISFFMGLVIFYALINWMPILLRDAGIDAKSAILITALFPLGGMGNILLGWLMDRYNANYVVAACFVLTAVLIWAIGQVSHYPSLLMVIVFVAGAFMNTAQASMPALASAFYPTSARATGVAWMLGLGRFGGIAGSFLVAFLSARHFSFSTIFSIIAATALVSALALLLKQACDPTIASKPPRE